MILRKENQQLQEEKKIKKPSNIQQIPELLFKIHPILAGKGKWKDPTDGKGR